MDEYLQQEVDSLQNLENRITDLYDLFRSDLMGFFLEDLSSEERFNISHAINTLLTRVQLARLRLEQQLQNQ